MNPDENAFAIELRQNGLKVEQQHPMLKTAFQNERYVNSMAMHASPKGTSFGASPEGTSFGA